MVKSPAAPVPCCKTIPPLWEAVEFPLSMVQMTPACKPLTEMFLDSVSAAGRGRGRGWQWGVVTPGCYFSSLGWSLGAVVSVPWVVRALERGSRFQCRFFASLSQLPTCDCISKRCPKALCCPDKRVQDPCVGSQVNLAVYISLSLFPARICQAWLVFTLAIWSFISQPHTCCSSHLDCWAFAIFLVNRCYLLSLLGFPS